MSSFLNEQDWIRVRALLNQDPASHPLVNQQLLQTVAWKTPIVDDVSTTLLNSAPTEASIELLYNWSRFLSANMLKLNGGTAVQKQFELTAAIGYLFAYVSRPTKIPFKYWSHSAPQFFAEARRFNAQTKSWNEFWESELNGNLMKESEAALRANLESAEIYERWERENLYG